MPTKRPGRRAIAIEPLFLVSFVPARAQQLSSDSERFNLHGKVLNPSSGEPISGALILTTGNKLNSPQTTEPSTSGISRVVRTTLPQHASPASSTLFK
jgi:hypothetical protein